LILLRQTGLALLDRKGWLDILLNVLLEESPMARVPTIIPITDLRQDAAAALEQVKSSREPVIITQRGRPAAVLLSLEAYERSEHERELLHLLARGEQEIAAGTGFDLDMVLAEADGLLASGSK
jgi:prevent-host-death family protein